MYLTDKTVSLDTDIEADCYSDDEAQLAYQFVTRDPSLFNEDLENPNRPVETLVSLT
jgi:hypothetical protein